MEQCQADASSCDPESRIGLTRSEERHGEDVTGTTDDYNCRICGFIATSVRALSQHLHSSHPVTTLPGPSSLNDETSRGKEEGDVQVTCVDQSSEGHRSPLTGKTVFSEGATLSLPKRSEMSRSKCTVEKRVSETDQKDTVRNRTASKASKSTSPSSILPWRKVSSSSGSSRGSQSEDSAAAGTSGLNQTPLVCLPLVSEGLKLVWVRSEQTYELDGVSELVEAFNAFPYPTEQEAGALARRCSLPADRVKVWFMMQRIRYGISWADADIRQTRLRLRRLRGGSAGEAFEEEEEDGEDELRDFMVHEKTRQERAQQGFEQTSARDACNGETDHGSLPQHCASVYRSGAIIQYGAINQYANGLEQPLEYRAEAQHTSAFEPSSPHRVPPQSHNRMNHLHPGEADIQDPSVYVCPPQPSTGDHHISGQQYMALMYPPRTEPCRAPTAQLRKKSKAQLMVLRRSFVHRNWPTEAEVQRLQRVTGLGRHEIRKWFADSRYQLRRSGRGWLAGDGRRSRPQQLGRLRKQLDTGSLCGSNEAAGSGAGFEIELDMDVEGKHGPLVERVSGSDAGKEGESQDLELANSHTSIKQEQQEVDIHLSMDPSPSPSSSSPSPSFLQGHAPSAGPEPYLRKKTQEQLDVLRRSFLSCQWPSSDDYTLLQRMTGLTRTEIVQWFGDTRYHIKHSNMRWMSPENRERIIVGLTKQQRRGGRSSSSSSSSSRSRPWPEVTNAGFGLGTSQPSNGTGAGEVRTWDGLFRPSPSGLAGGEL